MAIKRGRCLWLLNHKTLRAFEVPMLIDMGFEVFCPKIFPYDEGNLSAEVTYDFDSTLSLPADVLTILNNENFYEPVSREVMHLLNQYFNIVFFGFFPNQLKMLVDNFSGVLVMRTFGLSNNYSYTDLIESVLGVGFFDKIANLRERFIFGQSYENLAEIECRELKNRAVYLPIGLKDSHVKDEWCGGDKRILFVCPKINISPYYKKIYMDFKTDFKGFDYLIGGMQPIEVRNDQKVAGFIPNEEFEYNMKHLSVMFYHNREKRHLHFHPLEAVRCGMPLIFMSDGVLDTLGGKELPGRCKTIKEARKKIRRIMDGDKRFIAKIKSSQDILLRNFSYEYCHDIWSSRLEYVQRQIEFSKTEKKLYEKKKIKLAVLLPAEYLGGILDFTIRFLICMDKAIRETHSDVKLIFGHLKHDNYDAFTFKRIEKLGIEVREFQWEFLSRREINNIYHIEGYSLEADNEEFCVADDGASYFEDCDHIVFMADRAPAVYFSRRPYSVFVHDYIQRYVHFLSDEKAMDIFRLQRNAEYVFVTTDTTKSDCIQYAGIEEKKIKLFPLLFEKVGANGERRCDSDYFLWSTNISTHKNHLTALTALTAYYDCGGKLKCYISGVFSDLFDIAKPFNQKNAYIEKVRNKIANSERLRDNLVFCGNMDKEEYYRILQNARFMISPGYADNGNGSVVDAAFLNVPSLVSDYPAMRYIEDTMSLKLRFVPTFDHMAWSEALLQAERDCSEWRKILPTFDELEKYSTDYSYKKVYEIMRDVVGI